MDTINHWAVVESFRVVTIRGAEGTENTTAVWFDKRGEPYTKQWCITLQHTSAIVVAFTKSHHGRAPSSRFAGARDYPSDSSNAIGPSPPHRPRGRTRLRRRSDTGDSRHSSPTRSRSRRASDRRIRSEASSLGQHAARPSATGMADWTVASLKRQLTQHNIPFLHSDRKATLFRHLRNSLQNSTSRTPLPGRRRRDDDVTPPPSAQPSHSALTQGQVVSNRTLSVPASHSFSTVPQAPLSSRAHASHHPTIPPPPFNPSLSIPPSTATAAPPAPTQTTAASTATHGGTFSQTPFFPPPFPPTFPYPYPPYPYPYPPLPITLMSPAFLFPPRMSPFPPQPPPPAGSCSFPLYPPPAFQPLSSHSHTSSTPHGVPKTIPGVIRPQTADSCRELQTALGTFQLKQPLTTHSKELTAPEFTLAFSLYRDVICSAFPDRRSELDDYLSLTIDLALRFGGNGFYSYHTLFASQAAERLHQFNQGTYWGTLDIELYCRTFAARPSLHCDQCGAPSHSATTCSITTQLPRTSIPQKHNQTVSRNLPPAAPPPSITPKPAAPQSASLGPAPKGVNRRGRPILYQGGRILCNNFNDLGKTNQSGQPQPVYLFRLNSPLSPYEPLLNYINSRLACQASPLDPLFISETGRVATRSWFHHHFRQILLRSGIPPEPYSGHRSSLHRFQTGHTRQYHQNARPLGLDRVPSLRPKRPERHPKRTRASLHMKFSLGALIRRVAERRFPPLRVSIPPGSSQDSSGQPQDHSADGPASSLLLPFFPLPHPFTPHPFIPRPSSLHPSTPIPSSPLTLPQHITHAS
ncbi:hypothetical protein D9C73_000187 [Collichthys lucidus]|uniref:Uncharacterized protein n=1 Tax=Collichthys lucidus TaxID=240159 RepID=A0A4U5TYY3_COLLU|nr:hypothetical protein D9C73_000187 [Collichthys lucidus]